MKFLNVARRTFILAALLVTTTAAPAQAVNLPGSLTFFLDDAELWIMPVADLPAKLKPYGYATDPKSGYQWLGEPLDMMKRKAHFLSPDNPVWAAQMALGATLRSAQFTFLPPATVARLPDKSAWRALIKRLEDGLTAALRVKPSPHPPEIAFPHADGKPASSRWIGSGVSVVLTAYHREAGRTFIPVLLDVRITPVVAPGKPPVSKPPLPKGDKETGAVILDGVPAVSEWEGSHPDWLVMEQALGAIGLAGDRNGIREQFHYGISWPDSFCLGIDRLAAMSGARALALEPYVLAPVPRAALLKSVTAAGRKLNKPSPQVLLSITEVDPSVLSLARTGGSAVPQFMAAVKKAIAAGRPVLWYGLRGIYPEAPAVPSGPPALSFRLITGYVPADGLLVFSGPDGRPAGRIKASDALAASYYITDLQKK